jgi:hypothetical protein
VELCATNGPSPPDGGGAKRSGNWFLLDARRDRRRIAAMRYQLGLQFRGDSFADYDQMVSVEDKLIETLGHSAKIDGHDCGSDESNIFILTSDPKAAFGVVRQVLQQQERLGALTAAFRSVNGEKCTILWPEDSTREFTIV